MSWRREHLHGKIMGKSVVLGKNEKYIEFYHTARARKGQRNKFSLISERTVLNVVDL
jgi:hypothetical protein